MDLAANEREARTELGQCLGYSSEQRLLEVTLCGALGDIEKVEVVRVLRELLSKLRFCCRESKLEIGWRCAATLQRLVLHVVE
jgi:hypothetical protein